MFVSAFSLCRNNRNRLKWKACHGLNQGAPWPDGVGLDWDPEETSDILSLFCDANQSLYETVWGWGREREQHPLFKGVIKRLRSVQGSFSAGSWCWRTLFITFFIIIMVVIIIIRSILNLRLFLPSKVDILSRPRPHIHLTLNLSKGESYSWESCFYIVLHCVQKAGMHNYYNPVCLHPELWLKNRQTSRVFDD